MRTTSTRFLPLVLVAAVALPPDAARSAETYTGVISEEACLLNHNAMRMDPTDAGCVKACADEHGTPLVLVAGDAVYALSDQEAAKAHAAEKVTVTGTLDAAARRITVTSIVAAK